MYAMFSVIYQLFFYYYMEKCLFGKLVKTSNEKARASCPVNSSVVCVTSWFDYIDGIKLYQNNIVRAITYLPFRLIVTINIKYIFDKNYSQIKQYSYCRLLHNPKTLYKSLRDSLLGYVLHFFPSILINFSIATYELL